MFHPKHVLSSSKNIGMNFKSTVWLIKAISYCCYEALIMIIMITIVIVMITYRGLAQEHHCSSTALSSILKNYFLISWQFHFCETFVTYKAFRIFRASRYCLCFFLTPVLCMLNSFIISSSSNCIISTTTEEQAGDDATITICFLPCHLSLEHLFHTNTLTGSLVFWLNAGKHRMKIECWLDRTIISLFKRFLENTLQVIWLV